MESRFCRRKFSMLFQDGHTIAVSRPNFLIRKLPKTENFTDDSESIDAPAIERFNVCSKPPLYLVLSWKIALWRPVHKSEFIEFNKLSRLRPAR